MITGQYVRKGHERAVKLALNGIMREMNGPMKEVEQELRTMFSDASGEAQKVALHLVKGGGKRVRPLMTLLGARLFSENAEPAVPIAVAAEMIHMATLVHDDVIDRADTRRGRETVSARWGEHTAVLAGDALLARALVILVDRATPQVVRIMSDMIYRMCEGEIAQQNAMFDPNQTEEAYFRRIEKKTALFFAACCQAGGLIQGASQGEATALWNYGLNIGMAFQIVDDLLDMTAAEDVLGKPVGSDLASGVLTLPILYLMAQSEAPDWVRVSLSEPPISREEVQDILALVRGNGALDYTESVAASFIAKAKDQLLDLPAGDVNDLLGVVAEGVLTRQF